MSQKFTNEETKLFLERITPNKDCLYIFQPMGLADMLCAGGLSYAAQEKFGKSSTVLIVHENAKNFGIAYENVSKISYIAPQILDAIKKYLEDNDIHHTDNFIYGYFDTNKLTNFTVAEGLNMVDYYKQKVFDIPPDTPCRPPIITPFSAEEIDYWNNNYVLDKERAIILSPYANFKSAEEINFWHNMARKLTEKNYIVYTYLEHSSQKPFPNTAPIWANVSELSYIANNVKCVISSDLGVAFLLAMNTATNILLINRFPAWFWDVVQIFPSSNSRTLYEVSDFIKPIIEICKKDDIIPQIEFSHPKINSADIFYSYESMLSGILDAVEKI